MGDRKMDKNTATRKTLRNGFSMELEQCPVCDVPFSTELNGLSIKSRSCGLMRNCICFLTSLELAEDLGVNN